MSNGRTLRLGNELMLGDVSLNRTSTSDQIASVLREKILSGEIRPGTRLREVSLSETFSVSRNTMREAIRKLVYEGLIRHNLHQGATITSLGADDVRDIYQARRTIELTAVDALSALDERQYRQLRRSVEDLEEAVQQEDWMRLVELDTQFHLQIVATHGSDRLDRFFFRTLLAELRLGLVLVDRSDSDVAEHLVGEHKEILRLVQQGEVDEAKAALKKHLDDAEARLLEVIDSHLADDAT